MKYEQVIKRKMCLKGALERPSVFVAMVFLTIGVMWATTISAAVPGCPASGVDLIATNNPSESQFVGHPTISDDGKVVAFNCDVPQTDSVCIKDYRNPGPAVETTIANAFDPDINADGSYIVFRRSPSGSNNKGSWLLYVYDTSTSESILISRNPQGEPVLEDYRNPVISKDCILFDSYSDELLAEDNNGQGDVFLHCLNNGEFGQTTLVSVSNTGQQGDGDSGGAKFRSAMDLDVLRVAFWSEASNLVANDLNDAPDIFLRDLRRKTTIRASRRTNGQELYYGASFVGLNIYASEVLFSADNDNLNWNNLFSFDTKTQSVKRLSMPVSGVEMEDDVPERTSDWIDAAFSAGQNLVYFTSRADNLVDGDDNGDFFEGEDIFGLNLETGEFRLLSWDIDGNGDCVRAESAWNPSVSVNGWMVYETTRGIFRSRPDLVAPRLSATVTPNSGVASDRFQLTGTVFDRSPSPIAAYQLDGGEFQPVSVTLEPGSFKGLVDLSFPGTGLVPGQHEICLRANDLNDNQAFKCAQFYILDEAQFGAFTVRCTHSPLFPEPGESVLYRARAFDIDDQEITNPDWLEVWVEDRSAPVERVEGFLEEVASIPAAGTSVRYGCRAQVNGEIKWSGWKLHAVQGYTDTRAIPIMQSGPVEERVDIVLIPDIDSYSGITDPDFLSDAREMMVNGYFADAWFRNQQNRFNFWLSADVGKGDRVDYDNCILKFPGDGDDFPADVQGIWEEQYAFADTGALIHTDNFRDCAKRSLGIFSVTAGNTDTIRHETGHTPFGLRDEYCCNTVYGESELMPNVWASQSNCEDDLVHLDPGNVCRSVTSTINDSTWWISDPDADHLMSDSGKPKSADLRRFNWLLQQCAEGDC